MERRGGDPTKVEIAENAWRIIFQETSRVDKAFAYLAMAGDKGLDIVMRSRKPRKTIGTL